MLTLQTQISFICDFFLSAESGPQGLIVIGKCSTTKPHSQPLRHSSNPFSVLLRPTVVEPCFLSDAEDQQCPLISSTGSQGSVQLRIRGLFPVPPAASTAAETSLECQGSQDSNGLLLLAPTFICKTEKRREQGRDRVGKEGTQLCCFLFPTLSCF